jgi:hypothetical protein
MPAVNSYNLDSIPNSYPPLAFYLTGIINQATGISVMDLLHYFPFIISVITIPVFFGVTRIFYPDNPFNRSLATLIFSTLPRSFEWFVMGGGITRSLGFFFALSAMYFYSRAIPKKKVGIDLILAGLLCSFTILSHPVAGLFLAFSILVLTLYSWPDNLFFPVIVGALALVGSAPWWMTVLGQHGFTPFAGAANTGHASWIDIGYLLTLNFNFENRFFLTLVSVLALLGLFSRKRKKALFLGILVGIGYLVVPRGGVDLLTSHLAILATLGITVLQETWDEREIRGEDGDGNNNWIGKRTKAFLLILIVYLFIGAFSYKYIDSKADLHLTNDEYQAMVWVREHTNENTTVMHLPPSSNYQDWWNDYFGEWMPAITQRYSVATVQGYEWMPGRFDERIEQYAALRSCTEGGVECVQNWVITYDSKTDYFLLSKRQHSQLVMNDFLESIDYIKVYENNDVIIFERDQ